MGPGLDCLRQLLVIDVEKIYIKSMLYAEKIKQSGQRLVLSYEKAVESLQFFSTKSTDFCRGRVCVKDFLVQLAAKLQIMKIGTGKS